MAGTITISTLNNDTGVLATQNGMTGIAKAWVNFAGASGTINGSFNVSSVTRTATGNYTVNFSTSLPNATYSVSGSVTPATSGSFGVGMTALSLATGSCVIQSFNNAGLLDLTGISASFFSS